MGETARGVGDPSELSWWFLCKSKTILKRHFYCRRARGRYLSPPPAAPLLRPLPPPSLLTPDSVQCTAVDDRQGERQEMKPATYSSPLVTVKPQGLWAEVLRHVSSKAFGRRREPVLCTGPQRPCAIHAASEVTEGLDRTTRVYA